MSDAESPPDATPLPPTGSEPAAPAQPELEDEFIELRKTRRVDVGVPCQYWTTHKPNRGRMLEVSLGGARIQSAVAPVAVEPEQTIRITFSLYKTSTPVEVSARVVRVIEPSVFAVEFKSMSTHVRSALRMAISRISTAGTDAPDSLMSRGKPDR